MSQAVFWGQDCVLLGLPAEEFLGLWVVHQDLCQVLLIQDEEVGESMRLHIGCTSVPSASRQQTDQSQRDTNFRENGVSTCFKVNHTSLPFLHSKMSDF